jgi:MoxR-like ATPase
VVPEDEIGEAFFDRFLLRLAVEPVSTQGFGQLLRVARPGTWTPPAADLQLSDGDLADLGSAAAQVTLSTEVITVLGDLRQYLAAAGGYVSDRRWVQIAWLMSVAAASEGRPSVSLWDLFVLTWCTAPDAQRQAAVRDWLCARLGVREAFSPPRVTRVVEAFEAQLEAERNANDLDYDESGRLRFSARELAAEVGDAKRGSQALRITHTRHRRYGSVHIQARTRQIDELLQRLDGYTAEVDRHRRSLAQYRADSIWLDEGFGARVEANLSATAQAIGALRERVVATRAGFESLPRLAQDSGSVPAPVQHDPVGVE